MASQNIARLGVVFALNSAEFSASVDKAISENNRLKSAIQRDSKSAQKLSQELQYQLEDYGKTVSKVTQMERLFNAETGKYRNAAPEIKARILEQARALDQLAESGRKAAMQQMKAMGGLSPQQQAQIGYQLTDIFTSLAGGQNPIMVMIQQGGQLRDVFGGFSNALKAIVNTIGPVRLAFGGLGLAFGGVAYAAYKGAEEMARLRDDFILTGNIAGLTQSKVLGLGNALSNDLNLSIGKSRELLNAMVASGKFTETSFESVSRVIAVFAKIAGVDGKQAAEALIPVLNGTASSARQLNEKYNFLTLAQYKQIEALERQGKLQESIRLQASLLEKSFTDQKRDLGTLEKAWDALTGAISRAKDALLNIGRADPIGRAKELEVLINTMYLNIERDRAAKIPEGALKTKEQKLAEMRRELYEIYERLAAEQDKAEKAAKAKQKEKEGIRGYDKLGGVEGVIARRQAEEKAALEAQFSVRTALTSEQAQIDLQYQQQIQMKLMEMRHKNEKENYELSKHNQNLFDSWLITAQQERDEKLRQLNTKRVLDYKQMLDEMQKEEVDAKVALEDATMNASKAQYEQFKQQSKDFELQKKMHEFRAANQFATEKEIQLERNRLEVARQIADVMADPKYNLTERGPGDRANVIENIRNQGKLNEELIRYADEMKKIEAMTDAVWGNMSRAIDNFVRTGKLSFKDLARSIIQDLIRIQLQAQMNTIFKFIGGLFSSGSSLTTGDFARMDRLSGKADGGPVAANTPYIVGERGPELFMPSSAGTIVPNHALGGGGPSIVYNGPYIAQLSAIDTQSATQFLASNKQAVWAANQSAQRSMPVSR